MNNDNQWPSGCLKIPSKFLADSWDDCKKITREVENFFSKKFGYPCILLPSGRSAISLSLQALNINRHNIVFAPNFSSYCVWNVLGRHSNPSVNIRKDTDLILAVHKYAEIYSLEEAESQPKIIEDSCDSLITNQDNMFPLGGAYEIFSLPKIMGTYGGGLLACLNTDYENKAREIIEGSPKIHHSQGHLRWQFHNGINDKYNIWEANEFQNFTLDMTALHQIKDNLDAFELNQKIIESRLSHLTQEYKELNITFDKGRLPPVITLSNIKQTSNLMYRMIDINKSLDNPLYQNEAILPLHFGIKDEEFSHLIKSVHVE